MAEELQRLVVSLEGRFNHFEKALDKVQRNTNRGARQVESRFKRMQGSVGQSLNGVGRMLVKTFAAPLIAGGIAGVAAQVGSLARSIAEVGDEARRAGVGVEAFQELKYVAQQNRIGVDSLTDGLKELNLRADEFIVTGSGPAAEAFNRLGYDAEELRKKLEDPSALFTEIIGKLGKLDKAAQIRVADEVFGGTGGEKFVQLIEQGEEGIRRTVEEARSLGLVMSEELIAKAEDVDRKFNTIATTVGTAVKGAIVEATSALIDMLNMLDSVENRSSENLETLIKAGRENRALFGTPGTDAYRQSLDDEQAMIDELIKRGGGSLSGGHAGLQSLLGVVEPPTPVSTLGTPPPKKTSGTDPIKAALRQAEAIQKVIEGLDFERAQLSRTSNEQELYNALKEAGVELNTEEGRAIASSVSALQIQRDALAETAAAQEALSDSVGSFVDDVAAGLKSGETLFESFANAAVNALQSLAQELIRTAAINAALSVAFGGIPSVGGPIALLDLFGNAQGNAFRNGRVVPFAKGGVLSGPTVFPMKDAIGMAGEAGEEAFVPLKRMASGNLGVEASGMGGTTYNFHIDAKGAEIGVEQKIVRAIKQIVPGMIHDQAPVAVGQFKYDRRRTPGL